MVPKFARLIRELCVIINTVMQKLYQEWGSLLNSLNREGLRPESLQRYADAVHENGAPLINCWGIIDGSVRPISRPGVNQRVLYNVHRRVHAIKYQSVNTPDWMVAVLHDQLHQMR